MTAARQSSITVPIPDISGVAFTTSADGLLIDLAHYAENDGPSSFAAAEAWGYDMIDIRASKPLAKAIGAGERPSVIWNV